MKVSVVRAIALAAALCAVWTFAGCGVTPKGETSAPESGSTQTAGSGVSSVSESSEEKSPEVKENALRNFFEKGAAVVLPEGAGIFLTEKARELCAAATEASGVESAVVTEAGSVERVLIVGGKEVPEALSAGLEESDFAFGTGEDGARLYLALGSDYAAETAVKAMKELLAREELSLPYVYKAKEGERATILRVGTYNIQNGAGVGHDFRVIAGDILAAKLDIVGLQEVDMHTNRVGGRDTMAELASLTGFEYYQYSKTIDFDGGEYGHGILSRYPILSYETVLMGGGGERRAYGHAVIEINGVQIDYFNTHLAWPEKSARKTQIHEITRVFNKCERAILTGDMNAVGTAEYENFFKDVGYANGNEGDFYHFISCPEDGAIDNVIFKNCFKLLNAKMEDAKVHSDHFMVWAELALPAEE